jgi:hypothetical protein
MAGSDMKSRRWRRVEYERLIETGFFQPGDPVELVDGQLIVAEPQGSRHFGAVRWTILPKRSVRQAIFFWEAGPPGDPFHARARNGSAG